jgi:hypothetical protein
MTDRQEDEFTPRSAVRRAAGRRCTPSTAGPVLPRPTSTARGRPRTGQHPQADQGPHHPHPEAVHLFLPTEVGHQRQDARPVRAQRRQANRARAGSLVLTVRAIVEILRGAPRILVEDRRHTASGPPQVHEVNTRSIAGQRCHRPERAAQPVDSTGTAILSLPLAPGLADPSARVPSMLANLLYPHR